MCGVVGRRKGCGGVELRRESSDRHAAGKLSCLVLIHLLLVFVGSLLHLNLQWYIPPLLTMSCFATIGTQNLWKKKLIEWHNSVSNTKTAAEFKHLES